MVLDLIYVVGGLALLLYCGDLLVRGAVGLAKSANLSPMLIGLTIVAFGTSAPELFVSLHAVSLGGSAEGIALGNVVGSNIANILLVLGVPALIYPTLCDQPSIRRTTLFMVGASLLFVWLCLNGDGAVTAPEGALLFACIVAYLVYLAASNRKSDVDALAEEVNDIECVPTSRPRMWLFIAGALIGLPLGSHLIVTGAVSLATAANISPAIIGLSIIAIGTSLPELATTVMAAMHRHCAVAIGNVLGSNLFNLLAIMGLSAIFAVEPIAVEPRFARIDLWAMVLCALIIVPYAFRHWTIGRYSGAAFIAAYLGFLALVFQNTGVPAQSEQVRAQDTALVSP